jgi:hypothetical protein
MTVSSPLKVPPIKLISCFTDSNKSFGSYRSSREICWHYHETTGLLTDAYSLHIWLLPVRRECKYQGHTWLLKVCNRSNEPRSCSITQVLSTWQSLLVSQRSLNLLCRSYISCSVCQCVCSMRDKQWTPMLEKVWLYRLNYAELVSRFQQIKQRNWKLSKFLNPYPDLLISFNLLLIPSTAPLVVLCSK